MATLTIKNLPDEIYAALTKRAKQNRRSINTEAIVQLEQKLVERKASAEETIKRIQKVRAKHPNLWVTDEDLEFAKNEGRP